MILKSNQPKRLIAPSPKRLKINVFCFAYRKLQLFMVGLFVMIV